MTVGDYALGIGIFINMAVLLYLACAIRKVRNEVSEHNVKEVAETAKAKGREEGRDDILNQLAGRVDRMVARNEADRQKDRT